MSAEACISRDSYCWPVCCERGVSYPLKNQPVDVLIRRGFLVQNEYDAYGFHWVDYRRVDRMRGRCELDKQGLHRLHRTRSCCFYRHLTFFGRGLLKPHVSGGVPCELHVPIADNSWRTTGESWYHPQHPQGACEDGGGSGGFQEKRRRGWHGNAA